MPMPPLKDLNCQYGAPMGRRDIEEIDTEFAGKVYLQYVPFVDGCYDRGGAYWGAPANLWRVYAEDEATEDEGADDIDQINVFDQPRCAGDILILDKLLRANSREAAKAAILEEYPNVRFYR